MSKKPGGMMACGCLGGREDIPVHKSHCDFVCLLGEVTLGAHTKVIIVMQCNGGQWATVLTWVYSLSID